MKINWALRLSTVFILCFSGILSATPNAKLDIFCAKNSNGDCAQRIVSALEQMGCGPVADSLACSDGAPEEPTQQYCTIETLNCYEPKADLVITTHCFGDNGKVSFLNFDRSLTLTWWMGFGPYLREVCKK